MKGAGIREFNRAVEILDLPDQSHLEEHEVLIKVQVVGVGNWDEFVRTGNWNIGISPPMALGVEAAGTVMAVGSEVTRFSSGDEVLVHAAPVSFQGTWAEQFITLESDLAHKPTTISWLIAGAFPVPALTALEVVRAVRCGPDDAVLVNGAGGVTGGLIVAAAAARGCHVIATCSPQAAPLVRDYGASNTIDYHDPHWREAAKRAAPRGFTSIINAVRGQAMSLVDLVSDRGHLATITGDPPHPERSITITNFYVTPDGAALESAASEFAARRPRFVVARARGLEAAGEVLAEVVAGTARGAQVLVP